MLPSVNLLGKKFPSLFVFSLSGERSRQRLFVQDDCYTFTNFTSTLFQIIILPKKNYDNSTLKIIKIEFCRFLIVALVTKV